MTRGFEIDHKDGYRTVAGWVAGEPEASRWFPVRMKGRKAVTIVTWRCNHCGLLESYAPASN
jgi:hypothetical protein